MTIALVDTSGLIHLFRKHPAALTWFNTQPNRLSISTTTWLEFMDGVPNRAGQALCLSLLAQFELIHQTEADQDWAMQQLALYRLSDGVHPEDCLIASICHRLQVPIYTHNVKDLQKLLPGHLIIRPFVA